MVHSEEFVAIYYLLPLIYLTMVSIAINLNAIKQVRLNECKVDSYQNFIRLYVTFLTKNTGKFKNFVVNEIDMFKPSKAVINNNP